MSWMIYGGGALRFFVGLVRTIDIFNFYDFFESFAAEYLVSVDDVQLADSNGWRDFLLATNDPQGDLDTDFLFATGDDEELGSIDAATTLKNVNADIGKIRELLDSAEFVIEPQIFYIAIERVISKITGIQQAITAGAEGKAFRHDLHLPACQSDKVFISRLKTVILQNLAETGLDVDRLSSLMNMSRRNLFRRIKSSTGLSPGELINEIRLRTARDLLLDRNMKMYEIAGQVGFKSRIVFTRNFTRLYGMSPTGFLKKHKSVQNQKNTPS